MSPTQEAVDTARQRVYRGAAWLDARLPNWHEEIDAGRIDVGSPMNCVIAQAVGKHFATALRTVDPDHTLWSLSTYGFAGRSGVDDALLNREWATLVMRRQFGERPPLRTRLWAALRRLMPR